MRRSPQRSTPFSTSAVLRTLMVAPFWNSSGEPPTCTHASDACLQEDWMFPTLCMYAPTCHKLLVPKSTNTSPARRAGDQQLSQWSQPVPMTSLTVQSTWGTRLSQPTLLPTLQHDTCQGEDKLFLGKRCALDHTWRQKHILSAIMNRKLSRDTIPTKSLRLFGFSKECAEAHEVPAPASHQDQAWPRSD